MLLQGQTLSAALCPCPAPGRPLPEPVTPWGSGDPAVAAEACPVKPPLSPGLSCLLAPCPSLRRVSSQGLHLKRCLGDAASGSGRCCSGCWCDKETPPRPLGRVNIWTALKYNQRSSAQLNALAVPQPSPTCEALPGSRPAARGSGLDTGTWGLNKTHFNICSRNA